MFTPFVTVVTCCMTYSLNVKCLTCCDVCLCKSVRYKYVITKCFPSSVISQMFLSGICNSLMFVSSKALKLCMFVIFFVCRVRNLKFAMNLKFATSKTLVNFMKKMMFCPKIGIFQFKKP